VKILIAPDKFKDALSAAAAARAIAAGVAEVRPAAVLELCPLADGGEGSGAILAAALGTTEQCLAALDPLGRPGRARWWLAADRRLAVVELAEAAGLQLLRLSERNALRTTSYGAGQLLAAARDAGCREVLVCIGGSATVDGGAGALQALGWRIYDVAGAELPVPLRGADLWRVAAFRPPENVAAIGTVRVLCDVDNPLLGPAGAVATFGRQKFAPDYPDWEEAARQLEAGLENWRLRLEDAPTAAAGGAPADGALADQPAAGAAGGFGYGLAAALGARLVPAADEILSVLDFDRRLASAGLCLTGEGRLDPSSLRGKVVGRVARAGRAAGVPVVALVGAVSGFDAGLTAVAAEAGLARIEVITPAGVPLEQALQETGARLRAAAARVLAEHIPMLER
jgi:glycerate kinase